MKNFVFYNPTRIYFGKGESIKIKNEYKGDEKILLLFGGGSIKKNGIYDEVKKYVTFTEEFEGIEPNPTHETCMKVVKVCKEKGITHILAVGGGSVIDASKYIALAAEWNQTQDPYDICKGYPIQNPAKIKIGVVVTLPAAGSESNNCFVISHKGTHAKLPGLHNSVFPVFCIIDPCHSFSLPKRQILNGIVDTYVHIFEQYHCHYQCGAGQDRQAEGLALALMDCALKTIENPTNYEARADLCYISNQALNGVIKSGVCDCWAAHMIGHQITAFYDLDHGQTLAMTLPAVMKYYEKKNEKKYIQIAKRIFNGKTAKDAVDGVENFFKKIGINTRLSEYELDDKHFESISKWFDKIPVGYDRSITSKEAMGILKSLL